MKILQLRGGQVLMYGLLGALIAAIIAILVNTETEKQFNIIGDYSLDLLHTSKEAEKILFFIDQSAKYSLQQSVYELAQNGGFADIDIEDVDIGSEIETETRSSCGRFKDANVWFELKKEPNDKYSEASCFDEKNAVTNLKYMFNKNLNKYLENYPENIPTNNYKYEIKDGLEIIGRAIKPLRLDILKEPKFLGLGEGAKETPTKEPTATPEGLLDFTGTELCKKGSECLLTKEAYDLLNKANAIAKQKGLSLEIAQGYRSIEEQQILWELNPDRSKVCFPSPKCPHYSGNAVDLRFKGKNKYTMTNKDWQLLHNIMTSKDVGWVRYSKESWHFECCGTVRYARAKEKDSTTG